MKTSAALRTGVTVAEFLAMEDASDEKHILWDGEVYSVVAMAGGTIDHAALSANAIIEIGVALRGQRCRVATSDLRVWVPRKQGIVYPDATVYCGRPELAEGTTTVLTNPLLVVEVLSEGTELFDRGEKFEGYRSIPSLRHFLMVATTHPLVEHYARGDGDAWILRTYGPGETVTLHGPDIALSVDALYAAPPDA
jgi:Uma2 family endonuclease